MGQNYSSLENDDINLPIQVNSFIPDDIFYSIFTFLPMRDICRIKLCSKRFYYLAQLSGNIFKFNGFSSADPEAVGVIVNMLTRENVAHIFRTCDLETLHIEDSQLKLISESCRNLQNLSLRKCLKITDQGMEFIVKNCQKLKRLDIVGNHYISGKGMKRLSELRLESLSVSSFSLIKDINPSSDYFSFFKDQPDRDRPLDVNYFLYEFFSHGNKAKYLKKLHINSDKKSISSFSSISRVLSVDDESLFRCFPPCSIEGSDGKYANIESLELCGYKNKTSLVYRDSLSIPVLFPNIERFEVWEGNTISDLYREDKLDRQILIEVPSHIKVLRIPKLQQAEFNLLDKFTELCSLSITSHHSRINNSTTFFDFSKLENCAKTLSVLEVTVGWCNFKSLSESTLSKFVNIRKLVMSFKDMNRVEFNKIFVPYLTKVGPQLRHLNIFLPTGYNITPWDFSFLKTLENCTILGLKEIREESGTKCLMKELEECSESLKNVVSLDLFGLSDAKNWMVNKIVSKLKGLEELVMFSVKLDPRDFIGLRGKYGIRLYIT